MENIAFSYLVSAELTDVGHRRKNNEDSLIRLPEAGVFCVADGMGGVQGGEVASKAVVDALRSEYTETPEAAFALTADASCRLMERALNKASRWIKERAEGLGLSGTGSTAVALVFDKVTPSQGIAIHAGDSRAYRLREDKLVQITTDHSVAAAAGLPDDSSLPPMFRGVITRAVGLERRVETDAVAFDVAPGDVFLLCSDGLSKMVNDRRLQKLLRKHRDDDPADTAKVLVDEALEAGGEDNVSVIVIRVAGELPKGPTMAIPPETLALEQLVAEEPEESHTSPADDHDATGETANGTGVAGTAGTLPGVITPSDDRINAHTPLTPNSGKGWPPKSSVRAMPPPAPKGMPTALKVLLGVILAAVAAGAGVWGWMEWQAAQKKAVTPMAAPAAGAQATNGVVAQPVEVAPREHTGAGPDLHGGTQE